MSELPTVITVDGPGGVGKGTLCQLLAKKLGWHLLDSGAIYRVLALAALRQQVDVTDENALASLAGALPVRFSGQYGQTRVLLGDDDVSEPIRTQAVAEAASRLAAFSVVREALLARQRAFRQPPGLVADGRDMGTVVFADAPVKLFLDASPQERAKRRMSQLQQQGFSVSFDALLCEIQQRDERDRQRAVAPLAPACDALFIDTTRLTIEQVLDQALAYANSRLER